MAKSGRERKAKRRAKQMAEAELQKLTDRWGGDMSDQRLISRAVKERWFTEADGEAVLKILEQPRNAKVKELAIAVVRNGLLSHDGRTAQAAVRNLIAMEAQNQKDEHHADPQEHEHKHVHIHDGSESRLDAILERLRLTEAVEQAEQGGPEEDCSVVEASDGHAGHNEGETETGGGDKGTT